MKKYIPEDMMKKSRFRDLYSSCETSTVLMTMSIMQKLIDENEEYADDENYGHLCNLFSAMAFCLAFEAQGSDRKKSLERVKTAMYEALKPQINRMKGLSKSPLFIPLLKMTMPLKLRKTMGYGWKVEFQKEKRAGFALITHECIYCQICNKYQIPELIPVFCHVDDLLYSDLPRVSFSYTQKLGTGGKLCDCKFQKRKM